MEEVTSDTSAFIENCLKIANNMLKLDSKHAWLDYDEEADVLYLSFQRPQRATKTIEVGDDLLLRKSGEQIVGLTILNASDK